MSTLLYCTHPPCKWRLMLPNKVRREWTRFFVQQMFFFFFYYRYCYYCYSTEHFTNHIIWKVQSNFIYCGIFFVKLAALTWTQTLRFMLPLLINRVDCDSILLIIIKKSKTPSVIKCHVEKHIIFWFNEIWMSVFTLTFVY